MQKIVDASGAELVFQVGTRVVIDDGAKLGVIDAVYLADGHEPQFSVRHTQPGGVITSRYYRADEIRLVVPDAAG